MGRKGICITEGLDCFLMIPVGLPELVSTSLSVKGIGFRCFDIFLILQYTTRTLPTTNNSRTAAEPVVAPIITDISDVAA